MALAVEKAVNRAILAEAKVELYEEKLKAKDDRIEALNLQIATLKEQKGDLLGANKERKEAREIDLERIADRDKLIAKQDAEIARLRHPGFFGTLFDPQFLKGGIAGFAACKIVDSFGGTSTILKSIPGISNNGFTPQFSYSQGYPVSFYQTDTEKKLRERLKH